MTIEPEALEKVPVNPFANVSPRRDHWLDAGAGVSSVLYRMVFNRDEVRIEFTLDRSSAEQNKALFDLLYARRHELEGNYGLPLSWRRMDDRKMSVIEAKQAFDEGHNKETWPAMIEWLVDHVQRMARVFGPEIPKLKAALKAPLGIAAQTE